ncbi:MAG TPA: histidine--tRNA ligase [Vicinamibacterales bacterium]|nr:histidine--tRNA ligase [Vicinamibacterales bacterium]
MMSTQPARGMRDFLPEDVRRRDYVVGIIREVYDRYGFEPLETPAAENIDTLLGKYGEEGNKLVFKILKRGEHEASGQADLALRYDLTVPFARVVAEYQATLPRIFKRYQIQPVWRAERPARGRFREFYQCDIDAIGSTSVLVEVELLAAASEVLTRLGFKDFVVKLNDRRLLTALLTTAGVPAAGHTEALTALDKLDKIGVEGVMKEFESRGIDAHSTARCMEFFTGGGKEEGVLDRLQRFLGGAEMVETMTTIMSMAQSTPAAGHVRIDPSLARGLSYYTGAIMEITVPDLPGSLGGGGRYDNLIGMFLGREVPACGFSLGLERILVAMHERGMFPPEVNQSFVDVVVAAIDENAQAAAIEAATDLRKAERLRVDLYPDVVTKMDKIFKYVDQRRAKFIAILGSNEVTAGTVTVRNVAAKTKETIPRDQAAAFIKRSLTD